MLRTPIEIKETPESERYIKPTAAWSQSIRQRMAYGVGFILGVGSYVPLLAKAFMNVLNSLNTPATHKEMGKYGLGILLFPLGAGLIALSGLVIPRKTGKYLQKLFLTGKYSFDKNSQTQAGLRSIQSEIGPQATPSETLAYHHMNGQDLPLTFPANRTFPEVKGRNGMIIDTLDIPSSDEKSETRYRLCFNTSTSYYQKHVPTVLEQSAVLKTHTRLFNYPGVTKPDSVESIDDIVNAGIAEVYDLAKRMQWTNAMLEKNLHLYSYCGGSIFLLSVALYFKQKHNVNLMVFLDRSPQSYSMATAYQLSAMLSLPVWYGKILIDLFLYASGHFNVDAINIIKQLNTNKVYYVNIGHPIAHKKKSHLQMLRHYLGVGKPELSADQTVLDGSTLADGIEQAGLHCGLPTLSIYKQLSATPALRMVVANPTRSDHLRPLDEFLMVAGSQVSQVTAVDYYAEALKAETERPSITY